MKEINNGGLVNPTLYRGGLTIRQYFAGQALIGALSNPNNNMWSTENILKCVERCYKFSDIMIEVGNEICETK